MCDRKGDMISIYCVATTVNIILYFVFVVTIEKCKQYKICFTRTNVLYAQKLMKLNTHFIF